MNGLEKMIYLVVTSDCAKLNRGEIRCWENLSENSYFSHFDNKLFALVLFLSFCAVHLFLSLFLPLSSFPQQSCSCLWCYISLAAIIMKNIFHNDNYFRKFSLVEISPRFFGDIKAATFVPSRHPPKLHQNGVRHSEHGHALFKAGQGNLLDNTASSSGVD